MNVAPLRDTYLPFGKPNFSDEEIAAVTRVMRSGWVGMGPETESFEQELRQDVGAPYVVTVNSCTSALFLSLLVHGVGPGDEVICPSLTWCSSANAALYLGATVRFCDVDRTSMCMTPATVKARLTNRTKAVVVVHYGGLAVDVAALRKSLPDSVAIIEDAAHAFRSVYPDGKRVGGSGNLTCFSFYANKNLSTGEGGAIALSDPGFAERLCSLRQHGLPSDAWKRFTHPMSIIAAQLSHLGYKMNYTDLQASIGRIQLRRLNEFHEIRRSIAEFYHRSLCEFVPQIHFQAGLLNPEHSRHLFVVRLPVEQLRYSRDEILLQLRKRNAGASIHYPPLHRMPLYANAGHDIETLPNVDWLFGGLLTLPISASMVLSDAEYVVQHLLDLLRTP
jgi:perosamine synthetase